MAAAAGLAGSCVARFSLALFRRTNSKSKTVLDFLSTPSPSARSGGALFLPHSHHRLRTTGCLSFCKVPSSSADADLTVVAPAVEEPSYNIKDAANTLDIRVGRIIRAWRHEEADSLYVEEVDVGEPEPRVVCSGLVNYIPLDILQGAKVVVLANLKPRSMRGVKSHGMLLAASNASHTHVELLVPPDNSIPGDRIWFGSELDQHILPDAATPNQVQKKKIWEMVQPHLKSDGSCTAVLGDHLMQTSSGPVVCKSLRNANIS